MRLLIDVTEWGSFQWLNEVRRRKWKEAFWHCPTGSDVFWKYDLNSLNDSDLLFPLQLLLLELLQGSGAHSKTGHKHCLLQHEFAFDHYDPGKPAWSGELSDVALGGNRDMIKNLKVHLESLKHSLEWNLIKKYLKRTKLHLHWDEIENLMIGVSEPEKSLALGSELVIDIEEYQCNWGDEVCFYDYFHRSENWKWRWQ